MYTIFRKMNNKVAKEMLKTFHKGQNIYLSFNVILQAYLMDYDRLSVTLLVSL